MGRITKEPELYYWEKEGRSIAVTKFQMTTNGNSKKVPDDHEIVVFGMEAEKAIESGISSDDIVLVKGRLKSKKTSEGKKLYEIYARTVEKVEVES
jgi:single-stranded DNA-binding protein